jgi:D-alanyl-D-alanine dipeptidase
MRNCLFIATGLLIAASCFAVTQWGADATSEAALDAALGRAKEDSAKSASSKITVCDGYRLPAESERKNIFLSSYVYLMSRGDMLTLLDKTNSVPDSYEPQDLVTLSGAMKLRKEAAAKFKEMADAAKKDNITLTPVSAYRSYGYQKALFARREAAKGTAYADQYIARPGHSQHQLGLAVDINITNVNFETTKTFAWLQKHAEEYGFTLSFPEGAQEKTGFFYEPWHWRYMTPEGAKLQNAFFAGSQHDTLSFLNKCLNIDGHGGSGKESAPVGF